MTEREYFDYFFEQSHHGCGSRLFYAVIVAVVALSIFCGCATKQSTESTIDRHYFELLKERMDSSMHSMSTWQQSIYEKQQSLVDSFRHSEKHDTSHVVVVGQNGDTIKETLVIREYIEKEHSTDSKETESLREQLIQTDSLLRVSLSKQEKMDSTLQSYQKTTVVEKDEPWYKKIWNSIVNVLAIIGLVIVFIYLFRFLIKRKGVF